LKIAIVGSREYPQLQMVEWFIRDLPNGVVIVSGGAKGVDIAAQEYAERRGLQTEIYKPILDGCNTRLEYTQRYYDRNQKIVDNSDLVVAFTEKDSGGTWDTIKRARKNGKPVKIIKPSLFFPPEEQEAEDEIKEEQEPVIDKPKGQGPFQIRRVSLGSYALRRKLYIDSLEWADIITMKDNEPEKLSEYMLPNFVNFFEKNNRLGYIHAITVPPRSTRNIGKSHVMDILSKRLADELGVDWVRMFEPWEKSTRGRFAKHGEIEITPEVSKYVGKVVWVCDDITTTNYTLKCAVQSLISLEIHAHGLAYVVMA
jgi:phosphoribosylpyrophosphate synthetase